LFFTELVLARVKVHLAYGEMNKAPADNAQRYLPKRHVSGRCAKAGKYLSQVCANFNKVTTSLRFWHLSIFAEKFTACLSQLNAPTVNHYMDTQRALR
jgi:hypothetical protein